MKISNFTIIKRLVIPLAFAGLFLLGFLTPSLQPHNMETSFEQDYSEFGCCSNDSDKLHLYVDADKDEKQKNQQNSINSIYIGYQSCDIEDGTSECPYGSITDAIYAGLQNEGKQDLTVTLQTSIFENVMLDKQIAMNIHNLRIEGEQQIKQGKVMLQNTDKGVNIPVLIVDAQSEKNDSRIYISIELSNILICFNQFVKDPSYSSQAPFNAPNLIHIISLGYQEDKLKFRLNECDLRGRGTGVYNSLLCIEQGDVEISNSTFKSIFYKEEFDGQILIPSIFAQSAAVDFGYKCGNVIINDSFFTNLYMLTHQQIKDGSTEDSIGVALTIRRNRNPKSFVVIRNTIFDRCWDVTQQQKGSPTSTIVILMNESQGSNSDFGNINLIDCNFIQCRGRRSGAVYLHSMDQLTSLSFINCIFNSNDFTGLWTTVDGGYSRDVSLYDSNALFADRTSYIHSEVIQDVSQKTNIEFLQCTSSTSALQYAVMYQLKDQDQILSFINYHIFHKHQLNEIFLGQTYYPIMPQYNNKQNRQQNNNKQQQQNQDKFDEWLNQLEKVGRGNIYALDDYGFGYSIETPCQSFSYALNISNKENIINPYIKLVNHIDNMNQIITQSDNYVNKVNIKSGGETLQKRFFFISNPGLYQPILSITNIRTNFSNLGFFIQGESWPDNDPTPSQYANAIEVFGCESELELNSVSLWAEAQGYEGNYWMNSYINVNDASLIISNSEMLNMTCLNTPISVNGQGKLLVTDTIFANLYRLSQGNIGGSGAININITQTLGKNSKIHHSHKNIEDNQWINLIRCQFINCGGNGADAGAVSLTGQLKPNQNEYLTSVTNCTFISCQGQRAGVIEVHQGIRLRYVNSSIFRKDCEAVGNSYQQEKAQFIFFFQFDVAKEDLVTHTVFNGNQFEKNGYQLPAKMESFDADLSSETLTIEDLTIKDLIDEIDDINVNILSIGIIFLISVSIAIVIVGLVLLIVFLILYNKQKRTKIPKRSSTYTVAPRAVIQGYDQPQQNVFSSLSQNETNQISNPEMQQEQQQQQQQQQQQLNISVSSTSQFSQQSSSLQNSNGNEIRNNNRYQQQIQMIQIPYSESSLDQQRPNQYLFIHQLNQDSGLQGKTNYIILQEIQNPDQNYVQYPQTPQSASEQEGIQQQRHYHQQHHQIDLDQQGNMTSIYIPSPILLYNREQEQQDQIIQQQQQFYQQNQFISLPQLQQQVQQLNLSEHLDHSSNANRYNINAMEQLRLDTSPYNQSQLKIPQFSQQQSSFNPLQINNQQLSNKHLNIASLQSQQLNLASQPDNLTCQLSDTNSFQHLHLDHQFHVSPFHSVTPSGQSISNSFSHSSFLSPQYTSSSFHSHSLSKSPEQSHSSFNPHTLQHSLSFSIQKSFLDESNNSANQQPQHEQYPEEQEEIKDYKEEEEQNQQ